MNSPIPCQKCGNYPKIDITKWNTYEVRCSCMEHPRFYSERRQLAIDKWNNYWQAIAWESAEPELVPCPWCKEKPAFYAHDAETGDYLIAPYTEYVITCINNNCPVSVTVTARTREEAVKNWNSIKDEQKKD